MIPLVLLATNNESVETWIQAYIQQESIASYNIFFIKPVKTEITIDQIRQLKKELILSSNSKRLFVIYSFDNATNEAQNALLKTLEEKNETNQFILIAQQSEKLLPTIRSRVKILNLEENKPAKNSSDSVAQKVLEALQTDSYAALGSAAVSGLTKEEVLNFFDDAILFVRTELTQKQSSTKIIKKALELKSLLSSNNLNPQLTLDSFLIFYKKQIAASLSSSSGSSQ